MLYNNSLTLWSLISSIVSIGIAVFAVWIGWLFYKKGSEAETRAETALAGIKGQTDTLAKLSSSQIRQLTKAVTQQSPTEKALIEALSKSIDRSEMIEKHIKVPTTEDTTVMRQEIVCAYILLYYYSAVGNNLLTYVLPHNDDEKVFEVISPYIDSTFADFKHMESVMSHVAEGEIRANPFVHLYAIKWTPCQD